MTASQPTSARMARHRPRHLMLSFALLAPSLAVLILFVAYPFGRTIWLSFYETDPFGGNRQFVGGSQFLDTLTSREFSSSLWVTLKFTLLTVPTGLILGLLLAVLAHQRLRGMAIYRTIFSSTVATSVAVASLMFLAVLSPSVGLVNQIIRSFGGEPIYFLQSTTWALIALAAVTVWQNLGIVFIVTSAGLQSLPEDLYESARLDGAGPIRRFFSLTIPLLSPTLLFGFVVLTITSFQTFGQVDLLTQGGPLRSTNLIVYSIFDTAFRSFDQGRAAAQAVVLFVILAALSFAQFHAAKRRVFYGR